MLFILTRIGNINYMGSQISNNFICGTIIISDVQYENF